jgi:hypothetical protein
MVSDNNEPADLAGFRARRAALKEAHRRLKARDNFTADKNSHFRSKIDEIWPKMALS